ncbi:MAG: very short patch repair endonuclease [Limisphaerales bacterium]
MNKLFAGLTRSELMSRIRSRGNKDTEVVLAKFFRRHKISGWRRQVQIIGKPVAAVYDRRSLRVATFGVHRAPLQKTFRVRPDFVFPKLKLAIFVDGCFWHGCPKHGTKPKGNAAFWRRKFSRNIARDRLVTRTLRRANWQVLRIWEHDLARKHEAHLLRRIQRKAC